MVTIRRVDDSWHIKEDDEAKTDEDIVLDGKIIKMLDAVKVRLRKDYDFAMVISGSVGSGKSNLGRLCARYVSDENFNVRKHIVQDVNDIEEVMTRAKKGEAIIFDEGSGIFASADALTKKTKHAQLVLDVCRQKNLCLIIIAPSFSRLASSVAIDRSTVMLRTYTHKSGRRGYFAFYGTRLKEKLYLNAKKTYGSIKEVRPKFRGTFGEDKSFDPEYRKVKDETLKKVLSSFGDKKKEKGPTPIEIKRAHRRELVRNNIDMDAKTIAKLLGLSLRRTYEIRQEILDEFAHQKTNGLLNDALISRN